MCGAWCACAWWAAVIVHARRLCVSQSHSCVLHRVCVRRRLPQPGEGPSRDMMLNGFWKHKMIGLTDEATPQVRLWVCDSA